MIVFLAALVTMGRVSRHDFTDWDDRYTIAQNPRLNPPSWESVAHYWKNGEFGLYVPGTYTTWAALARLAWVNVPDEKGYRLNPWIFHSANVLFHALAALAVYALLRRCVPQPKTHGAACFGAILFAVHPVQVESVAWASGMKDVLCGLFSLVALWQYVVSVQADSTRGRWLHFALATASFAWALLCKPSAVVVPGMALVLDWLMVRGSIRAAIRGTALWWPIAVAWMVVTRTAQPTYGIIGAPLGLRPLVALDAIAFYLGKLAWPVRLAVDYGRTPAIAQDRGWLWWTWLAPAMITMLLAWKPRPALIAAGLILVIAVGPVLGFVPFLFQYYTTVADHYLYLAMLGPAVALAWALARWDRATLGAICAITLLLLTIVSIRQAGTWQNDQTLFAHTMRVNPDSFQGRHNLGSALVREGDLLRGSRESLQKYLQARDLFVSAIQVRQNVNRGVDDYFDAHQNLALTLERLGQWEAALAERQTALKIALSMPQGVRGDLSDQSHRIARNLIMLQRWPEALPYLDAALKAQPGNGAAAADRQHVLKMMGK